MDKDKDFHIDALKMKDEIGAKLYKLFVVNGEFSLEKFREHHREMIRQGKITEYKSVEEYDALVKKSDEMCSSKQPS